MNCKISVFEYLGQKIMFLPDVNYFFGIKNDYDLKLGDYELSTKEILAIAKENDPDEYEVFIKTSFEERLNKIRAYDIKEIKEESSYGQYTLCLHPSRKCNLNCKYCFKESEYLGNEQLSFKVAKDAIDFLVDKYAPCASKYVVDLSGSGEPLLQIKLVKQIVDYCKKKRNDVCKNIEVMFCTNLTLLTPEIVDYLDNEPTIILGTSIDGDQLTNDNNRVYANEKGTYDDILKGLKLFKNKKLGFAVTITPLNQDVDCIYNHLYHLPSVDCISMKFIRNYDGSKYDFNKFDISYLISRYTELCNCILKELKNDNFEYLKKIIQGADYFGGLILGRLFKGTYKIHRCDAGKSRITVNDIGNIFACSVMYGNIDFRIGNIYRGIDSIKQSAFEMIPIESVKECKECLVRNNCGGECYVNAYIRNNNLYEPIYNMCKISLELNKLCMSMIEKIKRESNSMFNKLVKFAFQVSRYEMTPIEVWAIMEYLKLKNIHVAYADVISYIENRENIIVGVLNFLNQYDEAISLNKISTIDEINYPAIAIVNKVKSFSINFVVIIKNEKGLLTYKDYTLNNRKIDSVNFIRDLSDILIC